MLQKKCVCSCTELSGGTLSQEVNTTNASKCLAAPSNSSLPSDFDSYVKDECDTNVKMSPVEEPRPDNDVLRFQRRPSGTEVFRDEDIALCEDSSLQTVADDNKLSDASKDPTCSTSKTADEERVTDDIDWNTSVSEYHIAPVGDEDRCVRCNKPRPLQQCPVCHSMYASVAKHIGVHSVRKTHTPVVQLAVEDDASCLTEAPTTLKAGEGGSSDESHMCTDCGEILPSARALHSHTRSKTCLKFAICMICGTNCASEKSLRLHMKKSHATAEGVGNAHKDHISTKKRDDFSCAACEVEFASAELLSEHMEEHVDMDQRICRLCGKTFMRVDSLKSHMRSHTGTMPFQCEACGKACRTRRDLREHREVHSSEKSHVCSTCGKQFRLKKTYLRHKVTHGAVKNYACDYCDMRFWFNYRRTRHMLVHTGDKPYVCSSCGERFTQWNGLSQHRLRSCRK